MLQYGLDWDCWLLTDIFLRNQKTQKIDFFFNQWVEYNTYEDFVNGSNGTTSNYSGTVIQTPTSITISYLDKFGVKTFIYMRTFNEDRMDYVGLDNTWVRPFLSVRGLRIEDKFIRLNYNQTMLTQT